MNNIHGTAPLCSFTRFAHSFKILMHFIVQPLLSKKLCMQLKTQQASHSLKKYTAESATTPNLPVLIKLNGQSHYILCNKTAFHPQTHSPQMYKIPCFNFQTTENHPLNQHSERLHHANNSVPKIL